MVIGALLLFDQQLTLEALEDFVRDKLVRHRRFRQHVFEPARRFGRPCWSDDSAFDLRAHVRRLNPPEPVDAAALVGLVSERMNAPLPPDSSPWSFELVDLAPAGSALLVRIHHCIADGRALGLPARRARRRHLQCKGGNIARTKIVRTRSTASLLRPAHRPPSISHAIA